MIDKIKEIISESIEITPGIVSVVDCNKDKQEILVIERDQWFNYVNIQGTSKGYAIEFSILVKDYLNIENIIKKLTTTIKYQAKQEQIKIANISIFIKGVIYE
ncbi:hypothetical protein [Mycoplasma phocimorsus]|uniref:Uncharacterized protein n=1 Tax=Mycoplasma phocimorsus TaxID=3045839 RepID=A0AAJ1UZI7_9MOLU|nr:hypothetical protein [Mycoplasma phocimorsus]MDJ1645778.1 hypothetical protein [Mycoplasma phocimorsus]MDJ1646329.1 hypothetical protein [Mycoplasma phocimorsus]MDJ1647252.1 hypothetical protein [Mycoplasma phocimorsus]MDJ1647900.1 hypothetical protein [Mycoplasma phocimorsus]MDJ1648392.1 hypothetical protein [Mycoplasma phocimorsus]